MVRVIIDNETLLFLVLNLAIYKSQLNRKRGLVGFAISFQKPAFTTYTTQ